MFRTQSDYFPIPNPQLPRLTIIRIDYLVRVCGYGADEARKTLKRKDEVADAVRSLEKHNQERQHR